MSRPFLAPRRRHDRGGDAGISVVEVTVTMALLAVVMASVLQGFVSMQNAFQDTQIRAENLDEGMRLVRALTKDVRTAANQTNATGTYKGPFVYAGALRMVFCANLDETTGPVQVEVALQTDGSLTEKKWPPPTGQPAQCPPPNTAAWNAAQETRFVGRFITNSTTNPVFQYHTQLPANSPPGTKPPMVPWTSCTATDCAITNITDLDQVTNVRISLDVTSRSRNAPPTVIRTFVRLPNVDWNPGASQ